MSSSRSPSILGVIRSIILILFYPLYAAALSWKSARQGDSTKAATFGTFCLFSSCALSLMIFSFRKAVESEFPQGYISGSLALILYAFLGWWMFLFLHEKEPWQNPRNSGSPRFH